MLLSTIIILKKSTCVTYAYKSQGKGHRAHGRQRGAVVRRRRGPCPTARTTAPDPGRSHHTTPKMGAVCPGFTRGGEGTRGPDMSPRHQTRRPPQGSRRRSLSPTHAVATAASLLVASPHNKGTRNRTDPRPVATCSSTSTAHFQERLESSVAHPHGNDGP
jgi:hypothetical protein